MRPRSVRPDHGAVGLLGQNFEQHGVWHAAINDVHGVHAGLGGVQRARNLGQHAARDGAVGKQLVDAAGLLSDDADGGFGVEPTGRLLPYR